MDQGGQQGDPGTMTGDLAHIRALMERSTRFISLSGLSGVFAGGVALIGAWWAHRQLSANAYIPPSVAGEAYAPISDAGGLISPPFNDLAITLLIDAVVVLCTALLGAFWFTWRRSRRTGQSVWDASARRMMWNLMIPLVAGGITCLALMFHGLMGLVAPATLVFYGLALLNASKYTLDEIRWLALSELALGLVAFFRVDAGLLFWALGFGVLHIVYGGVMWMRNERGQQA